MEKIYRVQMNSNGMPIFSTAVEVDTDISEYSDKLWKNAYERGKADRPQGWIPCSERVPSEQGQYLVTFPLCNGEPWVYILSFNKGKFYETDDEWGDVEYDDVTAWMPLPKPYSNSSEKPNKSEIPTGSEKPNNSTRSILEQVGKE